MVLGDLLVADADDVCLPKGLPHWVLGQLFQDLWRCHDDLQDSKQCHLVQDIEPKCLFHNL